MNTAQNDDRESYESLYGEQGTVEGIVDEVQTSLTLLTALAGVLMVVASAIMGVGMVAGLIGIYGFAAFVLGLLGYGAIRALQRF